MSEQPTQAPAARMDPPEEGALNLRHYLDVLLKRKWLILCTAIVVIGGAAVWTFTQTRIYKASTTVLVEREAPQVLGGQVRDVVDTSMGNFWRNKEYMQTQAQVITSQTMALRVAEQLHLAQNKDFWPPQKEGDTTKQKTIDETAKALRGIIKAAAVKDANIIEISIEHRDAKLAARIANAIAQAYLDQTVEYKLSSATGASKWLADQLDDLKNQLEKSELALHQFKKNNNIISVSLEDKQSLITRRIEKINDALTDIELKRMALASQRKQILEAKKEDPLKVAIGPVMDSAAVRTLKNAYIEEHRKLEALKERYLGRHPLVLEQQSKVDSARSALTREINTELTAVDAKFAETKDNEGRLAAALQQAKNEALDLNKREVDYRRLQRGQENTAKLYAMVLGRMKESDLSAQLRVSNVRLLDKAATPQGPVRPRVQLNLVLAAFLGLLFGIGIAFLVDTLDNTVKGQQDVEQIPALVFLGLLPRIPGSPTQRSGSHRPGPNADLDLIVHRNPKSAVAESCRSMRTNLLFAATDRPLKKMVVTSPGPREGKTTMAVSLSIAMAQSGSRVLIVDTDMRRPRLHRIFGVPGAEGITSVLLGDGRIEDVIRSTEVPNLYVLPCGPTPPNPAELCQGDRFSALLVGLEEKFDRIVLDSPPAMLVTDAAVLSTLAHGTLLVARTSQTSRTALRDAFRQIGDVGGKVLGVVLNDMDLEQRGYGYYRYRGYGYYRYGYTHYGESEKEASG